jgi:hypothetical protein
MFGHEKLLSDGAEVDGVIIEAPQYFRGSTDMRGRYKVTVRVRFDDGATVEVDRKLHMSCGEHRAGFVLPMRYDPADRDKLEIDEPTLKARHDAALATTKEAAIARGEASARRGAGEDSALAELDDLDRL